MALFPAKPGRDRPKKTQKNFRTEYSFYLTRAGEFPKKFKKNIKIIQKNSKHISAFISCQIEPRQEKKEIKKKFVTDTISLDPS